MGKTVQALSFVALAIVAPFAIPALGIAAAGSIGALLATTAVEVGLALAQSALLGPAVPKALNQTNPISRLYASLDTTAPRKIVLGITAGAADVVYT